MGLNDLWLRVGAITRQRDAAAAAAATAARRNYGVSPSGQALSKQQERALAEGFNSRPASMAAPPTCAAPCQPIGHSEQQHSSNAMAHVAFEW